MTRSSGMLTLFSNASINGYEEKIARTNYARVTIYAKIMELPENDSVTVKVTVTEADPIDSGIPSDAKSRTFESTQDFRKFLTLKNVRGKTVKIQIEAYETNDTNKKVLVNNFSLGITSDPVNFSEA